MLAVHIDNLLFLLLIAMAAFLRLLASKAGDSKRKSQEPERPAPRPHPPQPIERAPEETDADRIRKFLQALGQEPTAKPPPPIAPRRPTYEKPIVVSHVPPFESPLPPLTTKPPELPRRVTLPRQITKPPYEAKTFTPKIPEAPTFEVQKEAPSPESAPLIKTTAEAYAIATQPVPKTDQEKMDIMVLLKSPGGLRNAIILREIFGPPRSLQPLAEPALSGQLLQ